MLNHLESFKTEMPLTLTSIAKAITNKADINVENAVLGSSDIKGPNLKHTLFLDALAPP